MTRYAKGTEVSPAKSKAEIEDTVTRYGATAFASGWLPDRAVISFEMRGIRVKFVLPLPDPKDKAFTEYVSKGRTWLRTDSAAATLYQGAIRQRWRALALVVKAKLEAVESGISVFEHEFLGNIVLPDGRTVAEHVAPQLVEIYNSGKVPPLLLEHH